MRRLWTWTGVILVATCVDLAARLAPGLRFGTALWIEAVVFLAAAFGLWRSYHRFPARPGWRRRLQVVIIASFLLGALRAALWASGQPVSRANVIILGLGIAGWLIWRYRPKPEPTGTEEMAIPGQPAEGIQRET